MIMSKKTKNVHLIKTDEPSRLGVFADTGKLFLRVPNDLPRGENVHVYITDDEEISGLENNIWVYNNGRVWLWENTMALVSNNKPKKIILTDNKDLIKDGVQAIDDDFLEWLVQNPSFEFVEFEKEHDDTVPYPKMRYVEPYKIVIPKEEPKQDLRKYPLTPDECFKQTTMKETIEEAARKFDKSKCKHFRREHTKEEVYDSFEEGFIEGAKYQAERMYSEEEVKLLIDFVEDCATNWDCDNDSHKYNTPYRMCEAEKVLNNLKRKNNETKPEPKRHVAKDMLDIIKN
jgi:hypothetical protein